MTFVGKVLVGVQLVMSLCFLVFAGAVFTAQQNWKTQAAGLASKLTAAESAARQKETDLANQLNARTDEVKNEKTRADTAETKLADAAKLASDRAAEIQRLDSQRTSLQAQANVSSIEMVSRKEEATTRLGENKVLHESRDALLVEKRGLEDEKFQLEREMERMQAKYDQLLEKLERHYQIARSHQIDLDNTGVATKEAPPPVVEGLVLDTKAGARGLTEFVEISIGSDDGLLKGHELFVYRNADQGKYLGKIRLVLVTPDRAVGTIVEKARNGVIQKDDVVTSKL